MTMPTDVEDHVCEDNLDGFCDTTCRVCGDVLDPRDLACSLCGTYPCHCDEAYEAAKEDRLMRGDW